MVLCEKDFDEEKLTKDLQDSNRKELDQVFGGDNKSEKSDTEDFGGAEQHQLTGSPPSISPEIHHSIGGDKESSAQPISPWHTTGDSEKVTLRQFEGHVSSPLPPVAAGDKHEGKPQIDFESWNNFLANHSLAKNLSQLLSSSPQLDLATTTLGSPGSNPFIPGSEPLTADNSPITLPTPPPFIDATTKEDNLSSITTNKTDNATNNETISSSTSSGFSTLETTTDSGFTTEKAENNTSFNETYQLISVTEIHRNKTASGNETISLSTSSLEIPTQRPSNRTDNRTTTKTEGEVIDEIIPTPETFVPIVANSSLPSLISTSPNGAVTIEDIDAEPDLIENFNGTEANSTLLTTGRVPLVIKNLTDTIPTPPPFIEAEVPILIPANSNVSEANTTAQPNITVTSLTTTRNFDIEPANNTESTTTHNSTVFETSILANISQLTGDLSTTNSSENTTSSWLTTSSSINTSELSNTSANGTFIHSDLFATGSTSANITSESTTSSSLNFTSDWLLSSYSANLTTEQTTTGLFVGNNITNGTGLISGSETVTESSSTAIPIFNSSESSSSAPNNTDSAVSTSTTVLISNRTEEANETVSIVRIGGLEGVPTTTSRISITSESSSTAANNVSLINNPGLITESSTSGNSLETTSTVATSQLQTTTTTTAAGVG